MGDAICVYLGKGAFKIAGYQLRGCAERYVHAFEALHSMDGVTLGMTAVDLRKTRGSPLKTLSPHRWLYDSIDEAHDGLLDVFFTPGATESSRRVVGVIFTGKADGAPPDMPKLLGLSRDELAQRFGAPFRQQQMPRSRGSYLQFRNGIIAVVQDGKTRGYGLYTLPHE